MDALRQSAGGLVRRDAARHAATLHSRPALRLRATHVDGVHPRVLRTSTHHVYN
jgi:hypothetical protein